MIQDRDEGEIYRCSNAVDETYAMDEHPNAGNTGQVRVIQVNFREEWSTVAG